MNKTESVRIRYEISMDELEKIIIAHLKASPKSRLRASSKGALIEEPVMFTLVYENSEKCELLY